MPTDVQPLDAPLSRVAVIVPCWRPGPELLPLVTALGPCGFGAIIVVDDGSGPVYAPVFDSVATLPRTKVLRHAVNRGKGRALKTAFDHVVTELPSIEAVVTADGDGQHAVADIRAVARAIHSNQKTCLLGTRAFGRGVPFRSRLGNAFTHSIFRLATGVRVADTQTGLRGIPAARLPELMLLPGERYEYEMAALARLCRNGQPLELPVQTIYIDGNRASHFRPVRDSLRVCLALLRLFRSPLPGPTLGRPD